MESSQAARIAELSRLNQIRKYAVIVAIGLLVVSLIAPNPILTMVRSLAWAVAGVVSLLQASKAKAMGLPSSYANAVIYFGVAVVAFLRAM